MRIGDGIALGIIDLWVPGVIIAFVLFEGVFLYWQISAGMKASGKADPEKMKKILGIVIAACLVLTVGVALFCANTYTELREDSIAKVCFVTTKEYRWDDERNDVRSYTFECDEKGNLSFTINMKDGESIAVLNTLHTISDGFKEKYETDELYLYSYVRHLSNQFDASGYYIEKNIVGKEHMEKLYNTPEQEKLWGYISDIID